MFLTKVTNIYSHQHFGVQSLSQKHLDRMRQRSNRKLDD